MLDKAQNALSLSVDRVPERYQILSVFHRRSLGEACNDYVLHVLHSLGD